MNQAVGHCRMNHSLQCPRVRRIQKSASKVRQHQHQTHLHVHAHTHTHTHTHTHKGVLMMNRDQPSVFSECSPSRPLACSLSRQPCRADLSLGTSLQIWLAQHMFSFNSVQFDNQIIQQIVLFHG